MLLNNVKHQLSRYDEDHLKGAYQLGRHSDMTARCHRMRSIKQLRGSRSALWPQFFVLVQIYQFDGPLAVCQISK
jgi:hypothetical protein